MSKCEGCPISGPCVGERPGKAFACKMTAGTESERRWVEHASDAPAPVYPTLAAQAVNLAGAAVRFVASGLATVDQAEYDRRRSVCLACPTGRHDAEADRCSACGCYLAVKPWSKAESCPDGHW